MPLNCCYLSWCSKHSGLLACSRLHAFFGMFVKTVKDAHKYFRIPWIVNVERRSYIRASGCSWWVMLLIIDWMIDWSYIYTLYQNICKDTACACVHVAEMDPDWPLDRKAIKEEAVVARWWVTTRLGNWSDGGGQATLMGWHRRSSPYYCMQHRFFRSCFLYTCFFLYGRQWIASFGIKKKCFVLLWWWVTNILSWLSTETWEIFGSSRGREDASRLLRGHEVNRGELWAKPHHEQWKIKFIFWGKEGTHPALLTCWWKKKAPLLIFLL